jgi:hypothetical protein
LNNALNAILNHISIFFTNPPPKDLPSHLLSPNPSAPTSEMEDISEWSFLPRYSSALATCKWGVNILEHLARRVVDFMVWGEDTADAIRIAIGGIRERIVRATLLAWHHGIPRIEPH